MFKGIVTRIIHKKLYESMSYYIECGGTGYNWIQHVNRMPCNRLPRIMKHYFPTGRRNHGRPLKRLLEM